MSEEKTPKVGIMTDHEGKPLKHEMDVGRVRRILR